MMQRSHGIGEARLGRRVVLPDGDEAAAVAIDLEQDELEILYEVGETLGGGATNEILQRLAGLALRATGAERCGILLSEEGANALRPVAGAARNGNQAVLDRQFKSMEPIDLSFTGPSGILRSHPGPLVIEDAQTSPVIPDPWKSLGSKSVALAFMRAQGARFGLIAVDYVSERHEFSHVEQRLLDAIASAAGIALYTARSIERETRALEVQRHVLECSAAIRAGKSLPRVMALVVKGMARLLSGTHARVFLLDEREEVLRLVAATGSKTPPRGDIVLADLPQDGVAYFRRTWEGDPNRPIPIRDVRTLAEWRDLVPTDVDYGLLLPLSERGRVLGVAVVGREGGGFDDDDIASGRALADQAAAAMSYARINEERQGRLRLIESVYGLHDTVAGALNFGTLIAQLNTWMSGRVGIDCVRVSFLDPVLCDVLDLEAPTERDDEVVRRWRKSRGATVRASGLAPEREGENLGFPIVMDRSIAGVFWVRAPHRPRRDELALIRVLAKGIGEAAMKLKLRKVVERRSRELAVAQERERIARDLHDTVGQALYGIGLKCTDAMHESQEPEMLRRLIELRGLASGGLSAVRSAVYALSFLHVRQRGLVASLRTLARQFTRNTQVPVFVRIDKSFPKLSEDTESALYRTVHEALVNVDRHARATGVILSLERQGGVVELVIRDDGIGLDQRDVKDWRSAAHFGLRTMAKCIEEVGGTFRAEPATPRGLEVRARVPVRDPVGAA
ncbi:MAG TPA: GAF domain-containing sensor histidine kinase [Actinomycetota bacterium]